MTGGPIIDVVDLITCQKDATVKSLFTNYLEQHEKNARFSRLKTIVLLTVAFSFINYHIASDLTAIPLFRWLLLKSQNRFIPILCLAFVFASAV